MKIRNINILILLFFSVFCLVGCGISNLNISTEYIEKNMYVGEKILLQTNAQDKEEVVWESDNEALATVSQNGLVTALSAGEVTITATYGQYISIAIINIYQRDIIQDIDISITGSQSVLVNETIKFSAKVTPTQYNSVSWSVSDKSVATIDQTGLLTALKPGIVTVRAALTQSPLNYKDVLVLVRTGDGVQDVINNYIYNNLYQTVGNYELLSIQTDCGDFIIDLPNCYFEKVELRSDCGDMTINTNYKKISFDTDMGEYKNLNLKNMGLLNKSPIVKKVVKKGKSVFSNLDLSVKNNKERYY